MISKVINLIYLLDYSTIQSCFRWNWSFTYFNYFV